MDEVLKIVVMGRACRNSANIKNRQPIGQMYIKAPEALGDFYKEIIADELNVKNVAFTDDVSSYTDYQFKPQLRTVGPKYGSEMCIRDRCKFRGCIIGGGSSDYHDTGRRLCDRGG